MDHVLIVEDEEPIRRLIRMSLLGAGYQCTCAADGQTAADLLEQNSYDLILLDVMLPGVDGFSLMDYIRPLGTPTIFLTARSSVADRVHGLKLGGDDYLVKPFDIAELLARVDAVLRRRGHTRRLQVADVIIDTDSYTVLRGGKPVELTLKEFDLLVLLVQNRNLVLTRDQIFEKVWGSDFIGQSRTLDLHIQRLRKKLGWQRRIRTIYKVGYCLDDPQ